MTADFAGIADNAIRILNLNENIDLDSVEHAARLTYALLQHLGNGRG